MTPGRAVETISIVACKLLNLLEMSLEVSIAHLRFFVVDISPHPPNWVDLTEDQSVNFILFLYEGVYVFVSRIGSTYRLAIF